MLSSSTACEIAQPRELKYARRSLGPHSLLSSLSLSLVSKFSPFSLKISPLIIFFFHFNFSLKSQPNHTLSYSHDLNISQIFTHTLSSIPPLVDLELGRGGSRESTPSSFLFLPRVTLLTHFLLPFL